MVSVKLLLIMQCVSVLGGCLLSNYCYICHVLALVLFAIKGSYFIYELQ